MTDLDARVAALMEIIGYDLSAKELEQAIRAELQKPANFLKERAQLEAEWVELRAMKRMEKPALHEPVTDAEVMRILDRVDGIVNEKELRGILIVANQELQGRAKPADICVDPTDPGYDVSVLREQIRHLERQIRQLHAGAQPAQEAVSDSDMWWYVPGKPAQEEITDDERYVMFKSAILGGVYSQLWNTLAYKAKDARLTSREIDEIINAAIRASKGEKT